MVKNHHKLARMFFFFILFDYLICNRIIEANANVLAIYNSIKRLHTIRKRLFDYSLVYFLFNKCKKIKSEICISHIYSHI
jgi:hypothetical protein